MYSGKEHYRWRHDPWHGLKTCPDESRPDLIKTYIEITPSDVVKYELDNKSGSGN